MAASDAEVGDEAGLRGTDHIVAAFYPEAALVGFTRVDATIQLYSQIHAVLQPHHRVLDFGAGRGAHIANDASSYRRDLQTLKGRCARLDGCDADPAILSNPFLDAAAVVGATGPLPYEDASFDLIVSNNVFEHVESPEPVAAELLRVLKPGGLLFATTPNRHGYIALAARLAGSPRHARALRSIQPGRQEGDIFPTHYRMNSKAALERLFASQAEIVIYPVASEPAYFLGSRALFRLLKAGHALLPARFRPTLHVIVRKRQETPAPAAA